MVDAAWYRLDNVGKFYAAQAGSAAQTTFRFSATMTDDVDENLLQKALTRTIHIFPGFNVSLRSGIFWHYLEPSGVSPTVEPETLPVCFRLHANRNSVLFRTSYYKQRINVEVSHMISDGRGTLEFLKTLLCAYLEERYGLDDLVQESTATDLQKTEDSYTANFEPKKAGSGHSDAVYRLSGWKDKTNPTFFEYHLSASAVHAQAKHMGVSITSLIIAAVIYAIRNTMPTSEQDRSIHLDIPVDLRQLFGSQTLRNFFGVSSVSYTPMKTRESLQNIAKAVQTQIANGTEPDTLKRRMNRMIKLEKNPALRIAPLFLKDMALKIAAAFDIRNITSTVSSIGRINMDPRVEPYIENINALTSTFGLNFVVCTFKDVLSVGISSIYTSHTILRTFCRVFSDLGIEGVMNLNKDATQVNEALKQAHLENSLKHIHAHWKARE